MDTKTCTNPACKQPNPQPVTEFSRDPRNHKKLLARCKSCIREAARKYVRSPEAIERQRQAAARYRNSEHGKLAMAQWAASERGKESHRRAKAKYRKSIKNNLAQKRYLQTEKGKATHQRAAISHRERYPLETAARKRINHLIQRGKMRPASDLLCAMCGNPADEYHHHLGYQPEHWLDVVPLCYYHHHVSPTVPEDVRDPERT